MSERERYGRDVVARGVRSGSGVRAFCEREGVSTASYDNWRRRIAAVDGEANGELPLFMAVWVGEESASAAASSAARGSAAAVEIALPSGIVVRVASGADRGTIADVLAALEWWDDLAAADGSHSALHAAHRHREGVRRVARAIVENELGEDPPSGHLFVFRNRCGDRLKILWWDRDGLALFCKKLEADCT